MQWLVASDWWLVAPGVIPIPQLRERNLALFFPVHPNCLESPSRLGQSEIPLPRLRDRNDNLHNRFSAPCQNSRVFTKSIPNPAGGATTTDRIP
jgi:hypothetical protein